MYTRFSPTYQSSFPSRGFVISKTRYKKAANHTQFCTHPLSRACVRAARGALSIERSYEFCTTVPYLHGSLAYEEWTRHWQRKHRSEDLVPPSQLHPYHQYGQDVKQSKSNYDRNHKCESTGGMYACSDISSQTKPVRLMCTQAIFLFRAIIYVPGKIFVRDMEIWFSEPGLHLYQPCRGGCRGGGG